MAIYQDNRGFVMRLGWLRLLFAVTVLILLGRLWYLSVVRYEHFSVLAERNQVRTIPLVAPRGLILDREGRVLVENSYGFDLGVYRDEDPDLDATGRFLEKGLGLYQEAFRERLEAASSLSIFRPVIVRENLSLDDISYLLAHRNEHPELEIFKTPRRMYRHGRLAAHLIGYVGEVSRGELETEEFENNRPGDLVGKFGVEKTYNLHLTGEDGHRRMQVDSRGKTLDEVDSTPFREGEPLQLTIDLDLQMAAEEALAEDSGAVVALDPNNGEILVLASRPSFDPNRFAARLSRDEWESLLETPGDPLQNKALQSTFSPGSIFKVVVALAGLEQGVVDGNNTAFCNGSITLYGHPFRCWNRGGHGRVNLVEAIQHSCNIYFYQLGQKLGIEQLADFSRRVGLGRRTGLDLVGEAAGLVPTPEWKKRTTGHPWYAGETISVAIGQGPVNVTPIQLARTIGAVATGKMPRPHLVRGDQHWGQEETGPWPGFAEEHLRLVREGMWRVVNLRGTGRGARVEGFQVSGKTGTVQTISKRTRAKLSAAKAEEYEPHAWFVGFAPRDDPRLVVAVLVQRGGSGSSAAAPVAGRIFRLFKEKMENATRVETVRPGDADDSSSTAGGG